MLYGIGSSYQVYTVNPATGSAVPVGAGFGAVPGNSYGMDFNPVPDRIRFYSDNDNNIRINPDTGLLAATDTNLAYAAGDVNAGKNPSVVGAGYTNSTNPAPPAVLTAGIQTTCVKRTTVQTGQHTLSASGEIMPRPIGKWKRKMRFSHTEFPILSTFPLPNRASILPRFPSPHP